MSASTESGRDLLAMRNEIGREDGPADIVFGPDFFHPSIREDFAPYAEAYEAAIERGEIIVNGSPLTMADLQKPISELFPDLHGRELENAMQELFQQIPDPIAA
jgi:hypothetical protein